VKIEPESAEFVGAPWILKDNLTIAGGDSVSIPLLTYGEGNSSFITVHTTAQRSPVLSDDSEYILTIKATALDRRAKEVRYKAWVEDGRLHIAKVK
jgi:hypothetical protein